PTPTIVSPSMRTSAFAVSLAVTTVPPRMIFLTVRSPFRSVAVREGAILSGSGRGVHASVVAWRAGAGGDESSLPSTMPIFVCYRGADAKREGMAMPSELKSALGSGAVFSDAELLPDEPHAELLLSELDRATALVAVIGPAWAKILSQRDPRHRDWVRIEIAA